MPEMGEAATAALINKLLDHDENDCPFCKENQKPENTPESNIKAEWDEDAAVARHEAIGNDADELERKLKAKGEPRPKDWTLEHGVWNCQHEEPDGLDLKNHRITPNPHHLIPGNESLKLVPALLKWIFAGEGHIEADIGYDVNNGENGIWLPSNNSMRKNVIGNASWECETVKITYANAAQPGRGSFHDRHVDYSEFVQKILKKIANRMEGRDARADCPYKTEKGSEKYKPPYALIERLNGVSRRRATRLRNYNPGEFEVPFYTSQLVGQRVQTIEDWDRGVETKIACPACGPKPPKKDGKAGKTKK
jgi:hypothetical protein